MESKSPREGDLKAKRSGAPRLLARLPVIIVVVGVLFAIALWDTSKRQKEAWIEGRAQERADEFARRMTMALETAGRTFEQAVLWGSRSRLEDDLAFQALGREILALDPAYLAVLLYRVGEEETGISVSSEHQAQAAAFADFFARSFGAMRLRARRIARRLAVPSESESAFSAGRGISTTKAVTIGGVPVVGLAGVRFDASGRPAVFGALLNVRQVLARELPRDADPFYFVVSGEEAMLYSNLPERLPWDERPPWRVERFIPFEDRRWSLEVWPSLSARGSLTYLDFAGLLILASWLLFSLSAALLAWSIVSRSKVLEREVEKRTAELSAKNKELEAKNAEIENFIYSISHDLKSPIVSIQGFASILEDELKGKLDENTLQYFGRIRANTDHMHNLIRDLLEFSRVGRLEDRPEVVHLSDLVKVVVEEHRSLLLQKRISVGVDGEFPAVKLPAKRVRQVIDNLISNAIKYIGSPEQPQIRVTATPQDGQVELCVQDNGLGIPKEFHEKVFMIFQRVHADLGIEGTGMGLSIVKKIVENLGGRIWVESEPGKGSTFHVLLPAEGAPVPELKQAA